MHSTDTAQAPLMLSVSGCRGLVGRSLTPPVAASFAAAFGTEIRRRGSDRPRIVLGRDSRPSGPMVTAAAAAGLAAVGCDVIDLGVVMTPTVGVAVRRLGADGGMVATASHNPIEWNGLKCIDGLGAAPPRETADAIVAGFSSGAFDWVEPVACGTVTEESGSTAAHIAVVLDLVDVDAIRAAGLRVVVDSVNGAGGPGARDLLDALGCTVVHLNGDPTGRFAHTPEPTETNLVDLCAAVAEDGGAACGFAQDPDGDRLAVVDGSGGYIGEEYTLVIAAKRMLDRRGGGPVAANLSTSRMIDDLAGRYDGATVHRTPVGEANVAAAMRSLSAVVGGEGNGGVIVPEVCWIRDSLVSMALTLDLLAATGSTLAELVADLPRYEMIKHKFDLGELGGLAAVESGIARVRTAFADQPLNDADGIRVDFEDGWVHLRPSNTEPIARLIAEAPSRDRAWELIDEVAVAAGLR